MSERDNSKSFFAKHDQLIVEQQELNPKLRSYVKFLATHHPFCKDMKLDRSQLLTRLSEFWPNDAEWLPQMREMWKLIADIVHMVPSHPINHDILLRVSVSASALDPAQIPRSKEATALATIDAAEGVLRSCLLPVLEKPHALDSLVIPSGLMLLCQPQGHLPDPFVDYRDELDIDASENLFEERHQDKQTQASYLRAKPSAPDVIMEKMELEQKRSNEWEMLRHEKEEQETEAFEETSVEADKPAAPATELTAEPHPARHDSLLHNNLNHVHADDNLKDG